MKTRRVSFRTDSTEHRHLRLRWQRERSPCETFSAWLRRVLMGDSGPRSPHRPLPMLGVRDLTTLLDCSRMTLHRMVRDGRFPPPVRLGGRIFWLRRPVFQWLRATFAAGPAPR